MLLEWQVATRPDATALHEVDGDTWSFARLAAEVGRIQAGLDARGIGPGDHVLIMCENGLRAAAMHVAVIAHGAVAVPVNTALVGPGLAHVLTHSDSRLLIADPAYLPRCLDLAATLSRRWRDFDIDRHRTHARMGSTHSNALAGRASRVPADRRPR